MNRHLTRGLLGLFLSIAVLMAVSSGAQETAAPQVLIETSKGNIVIELFESEVPATVQNFLDYVDAGFYDGTIFHRVISGFMVQGGGFTAEMLKKPTRRPVENEADKARPNTPGTLAMARLGDPHSATAQFFVNLVDNSYLNHQSKANGQTWGYTVFAQVVEGMEVVESIAGVQTTSKGMMRDVPVEPVLINKVSRRTGE